MKITNDMIDPQLRSIAWIGRLMMRPSERHLRMLRFLQKATKGRDIKGLDCSQVSIASQQGTHNIRARVYRPLDANPDLPVLLYLHGGGYAIGLPEDGGAVIKQFIDTRACVVVAPDYRKSLDAPYPAALDEAYDTLVWVRDNAAMLGTRTDQIMVGGHSAGGGLTAAVALRARDQGDVKISFQMPIYPMIDDRMTTQSATDTNDPVWSSKTNAVGWSLYLGDLMGKGDAVPYTAAPARATDLAGLPPTATYVGDLEPFRDETVAYVEALRQAGVPVDFKLFTGCFHGFDMVNPNAGVSKAATAFILEAFAHAVDNHFAPQN